MLSPTTISDLLFSTPFEPTATPDAETLLRRGIARHGQGDMHGALEDFRAAAEADTTRHQAWNNCGVVRQALGDLPGAVADFDRAVALDPHYADALNNRGRARHLLGDLPGARQDFDRSLEHATGRFTAVVLHNRATLRQAVEDWPGALADYDAALEQVPAQVVSLVSRATVRKQTLDLEGARADLDRALELTEPDEAAELYHQRGGVRVRLNDFVGAIADYDRALELSPRNYLIYLSRGHARYHRRDFRGIVDYRMAFRLNPEGAADELGRLLQEDARAFETVLDNCDRHVRINDHDAVAHMRRGLTLLLLGCDEEAAVALDRSRELDPEASDPLDRLVKVILALRSNQVG